MESQEKDFRIEMLRSYRALRRLTRDVISAHEIDRLRAIVTAADAEGFARKSDRFGFPAFLRGLMTAVALSAEFTVDKNMILAVLLSCLVPVSHPALDSVDSDVKRMMTGLEKVQSLYSQHSAMANENFRNLMLTFAEDIRVIIIMIVDRLALMRAINHHPDEEGVKEVAREGVYLYAQLAHRLGLYKIKGELEDMSLKYTNRDMYSRIARKLNETKRHRDAYMKSFIAPVKAALEAHGLKFDIKGRTKSIYSIWNKMETKHVPFKEVYDLYAMRIVFECDDQSKEKSICWAIYSAITDIYKLHPDRTRDWIAVPKANGYQALHLTVMGPDGNWVEVQIRSRRMDEIAEKGFAAHWKYKIGEGDEESELNVWLRTIKDILDNPEPSAIDFLDTLKLNLFASEIVVFTPKGELLTLPSGATVLDVAFALHSQLGIHCIAGKVNHKLVPLSHKLSSGDQVEVLTSKSQNPQPEWESFLATAKAKTRLRQALRRSRQPAVNEGRNILAEWLEVHGLPDNNAVISKMLGTFHVPNREELCYQIGEQEIVLGDFLVKSLKKQVATQSSGGLFSKLLKFNRKTSPKALPEAVADDKKPEINTKETYELRYDENGSNFKIAECCCPIPGDEVMGFIDDNGEVVVHALTCPRAQVLKAGFGSRIVATHWERVSGKSLAHVHVEGIDRHGILQELIQMISTHLAIDIRKLNIEAHDEVFECDLWVRVGDAEVVSALCEKVRTIDGVQQAARIH